MTSEKRFKGDLCKDIVCILILGLASAFLFWKNKWVGSIAGDLSGYHLYPYAALIEAAKTRELPLWMPNIWGGLTGLNNTMNPFYPLAWVLAPLFASADFGTIRVAIMEILLVLHIWIFETGLYAICRSVKMRRISALCAAVVCGLCGSLWPYLSWFGFIVTLSWTPMLLAGLIMLSENDRPVFGKYTVISAVLFAVQLLSGLNQVAVMSVLLWAFYYFFSLWQKRTSWMEIKKITLKFLCAGLIGVGLAAIVLVPVLAGGRANYRDVPGVGYLKSGDRIPFAYFIEETYGVYDMRSLFGTYASSLSVGICGIVLTVLGCFSRNRDSQRKNLKYFAMLTVVFAVFAGYAVGFPDILWYIPFVNQIREPVLYGLVFPIGIGILGGFGLESLFEFAGERKLSKVYYNVPLMIGLTGAVLLISILPNQRTSYNVAGCLLIIALLTAVCFTGKLRNAAVIALVFAMTLQNVWALRESLTSRGGEE